MSVEFTFINPGSVEDGHSSIVNPGETKTILVTQSTPTDTTENREVTIVREHTHISREIKVYEGTCYEDNSGGNFTEYYVEDRGQSYEWQAFNEDDQLVFGTRKYEILNGEAGQWELPEMTVVFRHMTGSQIEIPSAFLE